MTPAFFGHFITQDLPGGEDVWLIVSRYVFRDTRGVCHEVPAGTITDGGSIPRFLWSIVGHPRSTDAGQAYGLHDVHYRNGEIPRQRADEVLCEGMEVLGASWAKRQMVYAGLRAFGWFTWRRYRRRPVLHFDP